MNRFEIFVVKSLGKSFNFWASKNYLVILCFDQIYVFWFMCDFMKKKKIWF